MTNKQSDRLIKALSFSGRVRIIAAYTTRLVEEARKIHDTWPTATAAFGRALTGGVLMSALADAEEEITLQIVGSGPIGRILVVSGGTGVVRGTVSEPHTDLSLNQEGKLDVGGAVGLPGRLIVIKYQRTEHPYHGVVPLVSGEIGEDLAEYFSRSEQIPTAVGLGVKVNPNGDVLTAGGFILQVLPGVGDEELNKLNQVISSLTGVTGELEKADSLESFLSKILGGESRQTAQSWQKLEEVEPVYQCRCSKERFEKALISLGKKEVDELLLDQGRIETVCQFCHQKYEFTTGEAANWFK